MLNDTVIAYLCASGDIISSCHAVAHLNAGDEVCLKLNRDGTVGGGWLTSFSGVLVHPDLV
jgi:hypothetical protein